MFFKCKFLQEPDYVRLSSNRTLRAIPEVAKMTAFWISMYSSRVVSASFLDLTSNSIWLFLLFFSHIYFYINVKTSVLALGIVL